MFYVLLQLREFQLHTKNSSFSGTLEVFEKRFYFDYATHHGKFCNSLLNLFRLLALCVLSCFDHFASTSVLLNLFRLLAFQPSITNCFDHFASTSVLLNLFRLLALCVLSTIHHKLLWSLCITSLHQSVLPPPSPLYGISPQPWQSDPPSPCHAIPPLTHTFTFTSRTTLPYLSWISTRRYLKPQNEFDP